MAIHTREKIRKSFTTLLSNESTLPTVRSNRGTPLSESERPGIIIITGYESIDSDKFASRQSQDRTYTLSVSIQIGSTDAETIQNELDGHILNIEEAVLGWDYKSADVIRWKLDSIAQTVSDESSQYLAEATLTYDINYLAYGRNPEVTA